MAKSVNGGADDIDSDATTPICRCRVLYLGSAVPHITKDGLQGIQEPLRDLYPEQGVFWNADREHSATGIDSWLSVWSNGILVENVDDKGNTVRRFHPIESLHYCAAVRYVSVPASSTETKNSDGKIAKFLPLDSPFSKSATADSINGHPPLFACILRRTSGIKVLECHAFICKKEAAANALVRCCFHAYADTMHARQIELESPYEQLDKRRSRSIGSALDSQSLIDEKVSAWQKNSTGGSSSGSPDEVNGFADNRSISRQKARTPSVASLVSHQIAEQNGHGPPMEPIYYNGVGNGTLRSVRSFMSLATLKSQKKLRPRQIPMPMTAPPPPPPVMFATLSKKELKKVLKKESTLKRKHKYKDITGAFMPPSGYPLMYGPGPPAMPPMPPPHAMPIYAPLPPPGPGPFYTLDNRKGRMAPMPPPLHGPPPGHMLPAAENGHLITPPMMPDEPIYMPAMSSPNATLRPVTPHGEPIYFEGRNGPSLPPPLAPHMSTPPMFIQHPQTGNLVPCTIVPTLSRKELKEFEKHKALMKKAAKKEKKKQKNGKAVIGPLEPEIYQTRPFPYPPEMEHPDGVILAEGHPQACYSSTGGIYKKKGHLNERAFSYSIRQEHRSRSNSLSNLVFENGPPTSGTRNGEEVLNQSNHASSVSLRSNEPGPKQPYGPDFGHGLNENGSKVYLNGNGRMTSNGSFQVHPAEGIDPNLLASRMSNLKLNGNGLAHPPPPPPLPPNGYQYQKTATIKRL